MRFVPVSCLVRENVLTDPIAVGHCATKHLLCSALEKQFLNCCHNGIVCSGASFCGAGWWMFDFVTPIRIGVDVALCNKPLHQSSPGGRHWEQANYRNERLGVRILSNSVHALHRAPLSGLGFVAHERYHFSDIKSIARGYLTSNCLGYMTYLTNGHQQTKGGHRV